MDRVTTSFSSVFISFLCENINLNLNKMNYEDAEQLWGEIENQGFGYWVQHYGYEGEDKELEKLCEEAQFAMDKLDTYIRNIWDSHNIG